MDTLVILMVAFGLFAIIMLVLFYIYARKYYNNKHLVEDFNDDAVDNVNVEVLDIKLGDKTYTFDANNKQLALNQPVRFLVDGIYQDGIVSRANYMQEYTSVNLIPDKLVLEEKPAVDIPIAPVTPNTEPVIVDIPKVNEVTPSTEVTPTPKVGEEESIPIKKVDTI